MGQYISTGIVCQYCFKKSILESEYQDRYWHKMPFSKMKDEIIAQLFPGIYKYEEDKQYIYFTLSDSISTDDLLSCIKAYYSLINTGKADAKELESIKELLRDKTFDEAYALAESGPSYMFYKTRLGGGSGYYAYPLVIEGKRNFYEVQMSIITIDASSSKTSTEDDLLSYDFFTELLRYRMKPEKLADAMVIFLSP